MMAWIGLTRSQAGVLDLRLGKQPFITLSPTLDYCLLWMSLSTKKICMIHLCGKNNYNVIVFHKQPKNVALIM